MGKKIVKQTKDEDQPETKLTLKQQRFVEEYCKHFNATKAAVDAGYSIHTAASIGCENLIKPDIKEAIDLRVNALTMSANEALVRLTDFARGSFKPFLKITETGEVQNLTLDLYSDDAQQSLHLIKKIKQTKKFFGEELMDIVTEIEIHDAKDATVKVLQLHGKLIEKKQMDITSGGEKVQATHILFSKGDGQVGNSE